jgi:general secretion pathway protein K
MALVLVLWLVVLLSVIASAHSRNTRIETRLAARHVETSATRQVAEAAVQLAIYDLLSPDTVGHLDTNGGSREVTILGRDAEIAVRRASGFVDINKASEDLLHALFLAANVDDAMARQLTHSVMDWRDRDDLIHMHGAEDDDYRMAGLAWTARDGYFERIDELQYVYGMTLDVYRAVLPYVTVHSEQSGIDLDAAPDFLIKAFEESSVVMSGKSPATRAARNGNYYITVFVHGSQDVLVSIEAVVKISESDNDTFQLLEWRENARGNLQSKTEPLA